MLKKGIYKHHKGKLFEVVGNALRHSDLEPMVIYKEVKRDPTWVRPYKEFIEPINKTWRFTEVFTHEDK